MAKTNRSAVGASEDLEQKELKTRSHSKKSVDGPSSRTVIVHTGSQTRESLEDSVVATSVVRREEFRQRGATTVDQALSAKPAITLEQGVGGIGLRIGGLGPEYTAILVNGRPLTGRVAGTLDLRGLRLENVEQIEIVRGPSSALYGADALAGTINLVTRNASEPGFHGDASFMAGSRRTFDGGAFLQLGHGRWQGSVFGGGDRADEWRYRSTSIATTGDATAGWHLGGNLGWRADSANVHVRADYDRRGFAGVDALATGAVFDRQKLRERLISRVNAGFVHSDSTVTADVAFTTFRDQYALDQRRSDALDDYQDTRHHGLQSGLKLDQDLDDHNLSSGIDFQSELLSTQRIDPGRVERHRLGLFAQDKWVPKEVSWFHMLTGLRLDYDNRFGLYLSPRIAWSLGHRKLKLRPALGRGYRAPDLREMYLAFDNAGVGYQVRGNPELRPETSWSGTLDIDWNATTWLRFGAYGFYNFLVDAIVTGLARAPENGQPTLYSYVNVGQVRNFGTELRASIDATKVMRLSASYQYTNARNLEQNRALQGQAPHRLAADIRFFVGPTKWQTSFGGRVSWTAARPFYRSGNGEILELRASANTQVEARVSQTLTAHAEIYLNARNLVNAGDDQLNILPPRTFLAGFMGRF